MSNAGSITIAGNSAHPLTVNRLGYGTMRLTGEGIYGEPPNRPEALQILKKAIEKAKLNGFILTKNHHLVIGEDDLSGLKWFETQDIIWQHDFAKAFWGDDCTTSKFVDSIAGTKETRQEIAREWSQLLDYQYHLQQMVLESDPIKYLEKFVT